MITISKFNIELFPHNQLNLFSRTVLVRMEVISMKLKCGTDLEDIQLQLKS